MLQFPHLWRTVYVPMSVQTQEQLTVRPQQQPLGETVQQLRQLLLPRRGCHKCTSGSEDFQATMEAQHQQ